VSHAKCVADEISLWLFNGPETITDADMLHAVFTELVSTGFKELPRPGSGATLSRFSALADVASQSMPLAKLYEAHTDAKAILAELEHPLMDQGQSWGVFAADDPSATLTATPTGENSCRLNGSKAWCSGAAKISHALVTARSPDGDALLVAVELDHGLVAFRHDDWHAVGMAMTETSVATFRDVPGEIVARNNAYITRPGFWHGAVGIAACWYGGAAYLAEQLRLAMAKRPDPHGLAHLGAVTRDLHAARGALQHAAQVIDLNPTSDARPLALATRAIVEASAESILHHCGRALGARPYCTDARFAQMVADLPVFMRQSHAERDLAALGSCVAQFDSSWIQLHSSL
jgi:alkylation response protein AidB-like acyl-CoA dehydrogenase